MSANLFKEIKKTLISQAISAVIAALVTFVSAYFLLISHGTRISALEETSVRKDVLIETLTPMKEATERIETKLDRLIERESSK